jgi:hypothetical protein
MSDTGIMRGSDGSSAVEYERPIHAGMLMYAPLCWQHAPGLSPSNIMQPMPQEVCRHPCSCRKYLLSSMWRFFRMAGLVTAKHSAACL